MTLVNASNAQEPVNISASSDQFDFLVRDPDGTNNAGRYSWLTTDTDNPDDVQAFGTGFTNFNTNSPFGRVEQINIDLSNNNSVDVLITGITGAIGSGGVRAAGLSVITDGAGDFFREIFSFSDGMTGSAHNDTLDGGGGADGLFGGGGADSLFGGSGNDVLRGGAGADRLRGYTGNDRYDYNSVSESRGQSTDTIFGFSAPGNEPGDRIDLSTIDAIPGPASPGNDAFTFIDEVVAAGELTPAGSIYLRTSGTRTLLLANVNDNAAAEFGVLISDGVVSQFQYSAQDFIL